MISQNLREEAVLFIGALFSDRDIYDASEAILKENFGDIMYKTPSSPWQYTEYYKKELGEPLYRIFVFFSKIVDPACLVEAKMATQNIEQFFLRNNLRQINIDPGYLTLAKVVLASKKNYSHRIYIGKGIFAELELFYQNGTFNPMPYTYFDYRDRKLLSSFATARSLFKKRITKQAVPANS